MKNFFYDYLAIPLSILAMTFLLPPVLLGGFTVAEYLYPNFGSCEVKK